MSASEGIRGWHAAIAAGSDPAAIAALDGLPMTY